LTELKSKTTTKYYEPLFVCIITKAMHLEIVPNPTPKAFIATLKALIVKRELINYL
jgi:hypothetical protein